MKSKKCISLLMAVVLSLSLVACGSNTQTESEPKGEIQTESSQTETETNNQTDTSSEEKPAELKDLVVGTWVREYTFEGKYFVTIINIYKGGTGTFQTVETEEDYEIPETIGMADSTTWEIVDDVLNIEIAGDGFIISNTTMGFVYENEEEESIQTVDGTKTYYRQAE